MPSEFALVGVLGALAALWGGEPDLHSTTEFTALLEARGVSASDVLGVDEKGVPQLCGMSAPAPSVGRVETDAGAEALVAGARAWECVPGVVRDNGVETFYLRVNVNGPVRSVTLDGVSIGIVTPAPPPLALRDDGLGGDWLAGDYVYTAGPFAYDGSTLPLPATYLHDPDSPAGLHAVDVGTITVVEQNGAVSEFLVDPIIGLLRSDVPNTSFRLRSSYVLETPYMLNIRSATQETQRFLRLRGGDPRVLTQRAYQVMPDVADFFVFFSTDHVEVLPRVSAENFTAGLQASARVESTGTGRAPFDASVQYGSQGRLLGISVLDAYTRGITSNTVTHELLHQWGCYTDPSLGLNDGTSHYNPRCSAASLIGGFEWLAGGGGSFVLNCVEGRNGAHHASPLDRYMMGLVPGASVPPLYLNEGLVLPDACGQAVAPAEVVTIEDIQSVHGVRTPGPAATQRRFTLVFAAETRDRFMSLTELTYYTILAEHFGRMVSSGAPDPYVGFNWVPITRFFGEGVTWQTRIATSGVVGRYVFYESSYYDTSWGNPSLGCDAYVNGSGPCDDDTAIAVDKLALLPGETATFANYISYNKGINGIMVDIAGRDASCGPITAADFLFEDLGRDGDAECPGTSWCESNRPARAPLSVWVREGEGVGSSDRVVVTWGSNLLDPNLDLRGAVGNSSWLKVTVLANGNTCLSAPDVHHWGVAIGEGGPATSNATGWAPVRAGDVVLAREAAGGNRLVSPRPITDPFDYNRDGMVSQASDVDIARDHQTFALFTALSLISP